MKSAYKTGIYLALITAVISGFSNFANKFAVDIIKPPLIFTSTKNFGVGLLLIGILLISAKWKKLKYLTRKDYLILGLIGIVGGSIPFYLFFTGLSMVPAINAVLINKTLVFWVALLAIPLLKEKLSRLQFVAVILIFLGNLTIGGFKGFSFSEGEMFILIATLLWAVETVLARRILSRIDPDIVAGARMGFGSLLLLLSAVFVAPHALAKSMILTPTQWFWFLLTMFLLLGYVMSWYRALKYAPAIVVTSVLTVATLITNILSVIFITHTWTLILSPQTVWLVFGLSIFWLTTRKGDKNIWDSSAKPQNDRSG